MDKQAIQVLFGKCCFNLKSSGLVGLVGSNAACSCVWMHLEWFSSVLLCDSLLQSNASAVKIFYTMFNLTFNDVHQQIIQSEQMSHKSGKKAPLVSADNYQCNCFGNSQHPQLYFLSKHKSLEIKNKSPSNNQPHQEEIVVSLKNKGKLSLKKNNSSNQLQPLTSRTKDQYFPSPDPPPQKRDSRQMRYEEVCRPLEQVRHERNIYGEQRPIQAAIPRNNNHKTAIWQPFPIHYYSPPPTPYPIAFSPPRIYLPQTQIQTAPTLINFNRSPAQRSPPATPRQFTIHTEKAIETKNTISINELKESVQINVREPTRECTHQEIIEFELTEDNIDSPRLMPVERRLMVEPPNQNYFKNQNNPSRQGEYFNFGDTFKSSIEKPKPKLKNDTLKSRIEVKKSHINAFRQPEEEYVPKLKLGMRGLHEEKKEKVSLKRMNDVEEIHSMGDSEEVEDDKQSVVLGRLREYNGSSLDPTHSASLTLGSKLISMNTQSSIGRSYMKSFVFNSDKAHK